MNGLFPLSAQTTILKKYLNNISKLKRLRIHLSAHFVLRISANQDLTFVLSYVKMLACKEENVTFLNLYFHKHQLYHQINHKTTFANFHWKKLTSSTICRKHGISMELAWNHENSTLIPHCGNFKFHITYAEAGYQLWS